MSLILSRTYPDDEDEKNREYFWTVTSEGVYVGSIVYQGTMPKPMWQWSVTVQYPSPGVAKHGLADSRENAAKAFRSAWDKYRPAIGDDRWLQWIKHVELVDARAKAKRY
ncbi:MULTISPECIES: hypothetical protein [unclassified Bosea (in: a-proteobacteria)]|uniref:hypothetical protein n=1 Tax=unclassified Bosea (in: a-proteobacteria) TaxID=2653178 RepID=UPI000F750AD5|nr:MULTISPECIES: hypothetical protein [unclassified Bosea (in: a-proteobacteria)]AZO77451.1 hypothetical protein BLM15_07390 [Bosea sp. Tri-49]RXT22313.1 hypothetical protein B5U98_18045 [Bosea sp. Tri-39]RXT32655.1 hypothetical protein B5U99_28890 [Bosea sp. Tri-54]